MTASEHFHAGRLKDAIDVQVAKVKTLPTDRAARFFLFELFLFAGELDRARKQLDVLKYDDPRHSAAAEQYKFALDAGAKRRAVFAGTEQPRVPAGSPDHLQKRLEALPYLARGEHAEARKRLDEANAAVPNLAGALDGKPFDRIYDGDERFGTVLEVFATGGVYTWVALEQVESITMNPPQAPRDVVLRPANVTLTDGTTGDVFLPGLYPETDTHPDEEIKLGRGTEWLGADGEIIRGAGGRVLFVGSEFVPMHTINQIIRPTASV